MSKLEIYEVKVFKMNDYDWMCGYSKEEVIEEYKKEYGGEEIENVRECDLDKEGMWYGFDTIDELKHFLQIHKNETRKIRNDWTGNFQAVLWLSFREVLLENGNGNFPYIIASTEY